MQNLSLVSEGHQVSLRALQEHQIFYETVILYIPKNKSYRTLT